MGERDADEIRRLMAEGLDHYALGQAEAAVVCWRRVLEIELDHEEARDYLRAAEVDVEPPGNEGAASSADDGAPAARVAAATETPARPPVGDPANGSADPLLGEAIALLRAGELQAAVDLIESAGSDDPDALELHAYLELARSRLVRIYRGRVGSADGIPTLRISQAEVLKFNLPAQAGFLLSLVDGATSTRSLLDLAGMDPFDGLRALSSLLDAGILEVTA